MYTVINSKGRYTIVKRRNTIYTLSNETRGKRWETQQEQIRDNKTWEVKLKKKDQRQKTKTQQSKLKTEKQEDNNIITKRNQNKIKHIIL